MTDHVQRKNIYAFNNNDIIATYDLDMDVWHPNRAKMASILCEILPFRKTEKLCFLDLGVGSGYLTQRIFNTFPNTSVVAIDSAELMIEHAKMRLKDHMEHIEFKVISFQKLTDNENTLSPMDAVVSAFALHHLYKEEKLKLYQYILSILKPNGWFVNCDIFHATDAVFEALFRHLHYMGTQERTRSMKGQEKTLDQIASEYEEKEKRDGDNLLMVSEDMHLLSEAGFRSVDCFWKEYREAVYGGIK